MDNITIGTNIKKARKEMKVSQVQLSHFFNRSNKLVSAWETGRCLPNALQLFRLALILDKPMLYFFNE